MKVAFHFNADHPVFFNTNYRYKGEELLFSVLLSRRNLSISSKVIIGDLLIDSLARDIEVKSDGSQIAIFNPDNFFKIIELWLRPENHVWSGMIDQRLNNVLGRNNIFIICFETIEIRLAEYINEKLQEESEAYLGALEVDDTSFIHWRLYTGSLPLEYRIINNNASIFWDDSIQDASIDKNDLIFWDDDSSWDDLIEEDSMDENGKDESLVEHLKEIGFRNIDFESLNGKHTLFDEHDGYEQAKKVAEWKKRFGNLLAVIADDVVFHLIDAAPDLYHKLFSILDTFDEAETIEEFSQVAVTCREIVGYISNQLFPPIDGEVDSQDLGNDKYKERLSVFAKVEKSDTNINLICVSATALNEQIEKLTNPDNKDIYTEVYRAAARRCLVRTIILLDDIASLKAGTLFGSSIERIKKLGFCFENFSFESLSSKPKILDEPYDHEQARKFATWKKRVSLLAFIADDVVNRLEDAAPDLGDKLLSMLNRFDDENKTTEQFAQVALTCRRIVEYICDELVPPTKEKVNGYDLGPTKHHNRFYKFFEEERKRDPNIDRICVSTKILDQQIKKLTELLNKGIHAEINKSEARRCLLRTIILLDDIASLKAGAFEIKTKLNFDEVIKNLEGEIGEIIKRNPNIDRILVITKALNQQRENLTELLNKGTHAEINKSEARCLLRTILSLLDDIASLNDAFGIKRKLNPEFFSQINQLKQLVDNQMFDSLEE